MTWYKLFPRSARLGASALSACLLTLAACDADEVFEPQSDAPLEATDATGEGSGTELVAFDDTVLAAASRRGIPIGHFAQPLSAFGRTYNGGHQNFSPRSIVRELKAIRARGGRVVIAFSGSPRYYRVNGHFSFERWKSRVNRFRGINLSQFVSDGTIIGHYMIDEPNDPRNWRGRPVSPATLEQMAKYSKQLWPRMPTIVRVEPGYLGRNHRYLDAAWAQYLHRKGPVESFLRRNVSAAQDRRLGLVVGLNVIKGGSPNGTKMTASEVKKWGSALLNSSYPCAFISWTYNRTYLSSGGVGDAMRALRRKAESRSARSCRG
jgi:hypothetical protein